jgi:hypothetical protein
LSVACLAVCKTLAASLSQQVFIQLLCAKRLYFLLLPQPSYIFCI